MCVGSAEFLFRWVGSWGRVMLLRVLLLGGTVVVVVVVVMVGWACLTGECLFPWSGPGRASPAMRREALPGCLGATRMGEDEDDDIEGAGFVDEGRGGGLRLGQQLTVGA